MQSIVFKVLRWLLGLIMVIIGLNKFLVYIEIPGPPGDGGELMRIYITSGFLKLVGVLECLGGAALLLNKLVPTALTFISAIMFNAAVFHVLHDAAGVGPAALCLLFSLLLIYAHKERFSEFLKI
ncbi:MAG: DoxX family membrane protein [Bacteroidota bacterium]